MEKQYVAGTSKRFCLNCNKVRIFEYEFYLRHSRCCHCLGWKARKPTEEELKGDL